MIPSQAMRQCWKEKKDSMQHSLLPAIVISQRSNCEQDGQGALRELKVR